jgi:hypothetical protein
LGKVGGGLFLEPILLGSSSGLSTNRFEDGRGSVVDKLG